MKKILVLFILCAFTMISYAQEKVVLKAGTIVPCEATETLRASKAYIGQTVNFRVTQNVMADGKIVIPAGTLAKGKVYEARKSTCFGTKGRLGIKVSNVILPSGDVIYLTDNNIYITGKNRTAVSVVIFCFTLLPFPCGSKAVMNAGYEFEPIVASNYTITI